MSIRTSISSVENLADLSPGAQGRDMLQEAGFAKTPEMTHDTPSPGNQILPPAL